MSFGRSLDKGVTNGLNVDSFISRMNAYIAREPAATRRALTTFQDQLTRSAQAAAPVATGALAGDIKPGRITFDKTTRTAEVLAGTGRSAPYAVAVHERNSPGRKFLTRPLFDNAQHYLRLAASAIKAIR